MRATAAFLALLWRFGASKSVIDKYDSDSSAIAFMEQASVSTCHKLTLEPPKGSAADDARLAALFAEAWGDGRRIERAAAFAAATERACGGGKSWKVHSSGHWFGVAAVLTHPAAKRNPAVAAYAAFGAVRDRFIWGGFHGVLKGLFLLEAPLNPREVLAARSNAVADAPLEDRATRAAAAKARLAKGRRDTAARTHAEARVETRSMQLECFGTDLQRPFSPVVESSGARTRGPLKLRKTTSSDSRVYREF